MSKTTLIIFWVIWLLDVLMGLFGYREFINGVFGQHAAPSSKYLVMWTVLLVAFFLILYGSLYFKTHERPSAALIVAAVPLVLALPYALFMAVVLMSGNTRWN